MKHTYFKSSKKEFKDSIVNQNENHEREIFSWRQGYPHTSFTYILSKDIFRHHRCQKVEADVLMVKGKSWCDKNIKIVAAGSNDSGVSWIVEVEGKRIFHAGDHSRTSKARDTTIL